MLAAALLLGWQAQAQIIVGGGYIHTLEKVRFSQENMSPENGGLNGIYVGANYYYSLDDVLDGLALVPGANVSMLMGHHWSYKDVEERELALNIPLAAGYTYPINDYLSLFGQTGLSLQIALSHKIQDKQGTTYSLLVKDNKFGESRGRFNLYWGIAGGVQLNEKVRIDLGWDLGLVNLNTHRADNNISRVSRSYLHLGVAFLF